MGEEKLYVITHENEIEPGYSRHNSYQPGNSSEDAKKRFLGDRKDLKIMGIEEFKIPGYQIRLEKLVDEADS